MKKYVWLTVFIGMVLVLSGCLDGNRSKNRHYASINNLKQIGLALMMYADDNRGNFPAPGARGKDNRPDVVGGLDCLIRHDYLCDFNVYIMPYDTMGKIAGNKASFDPVENCSYAYFGSGVAAGAVSGDFPIAIEKPWRLPASSTKLAVLFADGSGRSIEIPGVSSKSCREVAEILMGLNSFTDKEKKLLRENAVTADELR